MKILLSQSQFSLCKCKGNNHPITAGQLKQPDMIDNIVCHDQGFRFLRALRGSPLYFEKAKKRYLCNDKTIGLSIVAL